MASDTNSLDKIPNGKPVRIFMALTHGTERYRAQCVYHKTEAPKFSLLFRPGILPVDEISLSDPCIINIDLGGPTFSLEAAIQKVANSQTLEMIELNTINHEQLREFFRVDSTTKVISKSFLPEIIGNKGKPWAIQGQTVDISGSGLLAIFPERPPKDRQVRLEISIPSAEPETIKVLASLVRCQEISDGYFEVAYHFDDISSEERDTIIGCCLVIQRKLLRLKVQVKDTRLSS